MKLLFINNLFGKNALGGAETLVSQSMDEARATGNEVVVVSARPFIPPNICFYTTMMRLPLLLRLVWHIIDTLNPFSYFWISSMIRREKPDEIHTHNLKGIGLTSAIAIRLWGPRLMQSNGGRRQRADGESREATEPELVVPSSWIHTVHDVQLITPSGLILFGKENSWEHTNRFTRMYRLICKQFFGSPDEVRFPSKWIKNEYEKYGFFPKSKRVVVRNTLRHCEASCRSNLLHCVGDHDVATAPRDDVVMMYAGQLEPHKGIRVLMSAAKQCPEVTFHIYGGGSLEQEVRDIAKNNPHIFVHGRVSHEELQHAYQNSDTLIYPSLCYENAPMSIVEAKSAGLQIIASNIGGIPELLGQQDTLIIPNDVDALADAIKKHSP